MKLGYPFAINKSEDITLISFDSNTQLLSFKKGNKDCDCELIRIRIGLLYWSLRCARNLLRIFINKTKNGIKLSWIIFKTFLKKVINYVSLFLK